MRAKCILDKVENVKDIDLTAGKFYEVIETNIQTMASPDSFISVIGDRQLEIERPAKMFRIMVPSTSPRGNTRIRVPLRKLGQAINALFAADISPKVISSCVLEVPTARAKEALELVKSAKSV